VGKTTLLRILAGLTDPSDGSVRILGGDPKRDEIRSRIGWIPGGDRTFYMRLSGMENLIFFGRMYGLTASRARQLGSRLLDRVGLGGAGKKPTGTYSKGMLKRLAVARALLSEPAVLLCDETTHDLDPEGSGSIRELFRELSQEGIAIVWATQRLDELSHFAHSVTVLSEEGVAFSGRFDDLVHRIPSRSFEIRLASQADLGIKELLGNLGVRHHVNGAGSELIVEVDDLLPIGRVVAALGESGYTAVSINEIGSHVEAAYRHVLGTEQTDHY
jgi:ABC-type multidrug transport system ATPase subunit